ncbi:hypothetical protein ABFZ85_01975 [Hyphococcus formosus]|uniref:hypothetical protein n=1 Tax=Hyphococcus formosus TaxID=3143534 RepID=UPI00398B1FF9
MSDETELTPEFIAKWKKPNEPDWLENFYSFDLKKGEIAKLAQSIGIKKIIGLNDFWAFIAITANEYAQIKIFHDAHRNKKFLLRAISKIRNNPESFPKLYKENNAINSPAFTDELMVDPEFRKEIRSLKSKLTELEKNRPELAITINDNRQRYGASLEIDDDEIFADDFIRPDPLIHLLFAEHNKTDYETNNPNSDIRKSGLIKISHDEGNEVLTLPSLNSPEYKTFLLDQVAEILDSAPALQLRRRKNYPGIFLAQQLAIFWCEELGREYKRNKSDSEPITEMEMFIYTASEIIGDDAIANSALNYVRRHAYEKLEEDARQ